MDKTQAIKALGGTVARGILWGLGLLSQAIGGSFVAADNVSWAEGTAGILIGFIFEAIALFWSRKKDKRLLGTPAEDTEMESF